MFFRSLLLITLVAACAESSDAEFENTCDLVFDAAISCAEGADWDTTLYVSQRDDACTDWSAASEAECVTYYQCMADDVQVWRAIRPDGAFALVKMASSYSPTPSSTKT